MLEVICEVCGETFNPADPQDIIHMVKGDGTFCGGTGEIQGFYTWPQNPVIYIPPGRSLPTFGEPPPRDPKVVQISTGNEGGWCGNIQEHAAHDECEGT